MTRSTRFDRAKYLVKHADEIISRADEQSINWLAQSAGLLHGLFKFGTKGDAGGISLTIDMLVQLGWKKKLLRVFRVTATPKN